MLLKTHGKERKFKKDVFFIELGIILAALLGFVYNIWLARYLGPNNYGLIILLFFSIMIVGRFLAHGIKIALAKFISEDKATGKNIYKYISSGFKSCLYFLLIFIVFVFLFYDFIANYFFDGSIFFVLLFSFGVIFFVLSIILEGLLQGFRKMKLISIQQFLHGFLKVLSLGVVILFTGSLFGVSISIPIIFLTIFVLSYIMFKFGVKIRPKKGTDLSKKIMSFGLPVSIIRLCMVFVVLAGPFFVKILSNSNDMVALFTTSLILVSFPILLYEGILIPLLPNISIFNKLGKKSDIKRYLKNISIFTFFVSIILVIGSYFLGPFFVGLFFGQVFVIESFHIMLISVIISFRVFASVFSEFLIGMGNTKAVLLAWVLPFLVFPISLTISTNVFFSVEVTFIIYTLLVSCLLFYALIKKL